MNADLFFRTRTTRRTQTCADFFIWIEKINLRSSACSALRAFFRVVRVFFLFMGLFSWRIAKKILSPLVACGESYIFTPMRRGRAEAFFHALRNRAAKSRGVFAMCETMSRNRGEFSQCAKPCRGIAGSFRNVRNGVAKPREAFATCETMSRNRGKLSRKEK